MSGSWFFCGVGGSGMLPLASVLRAKGETVAGSDRALDQGRTAAKFDYLRAQGVTLHPQDGSGMTSAEQTLVVSAAVEDTIPDVKAAKTVGARIVTRAELLSELFNAAPLSVGVAGTSGKSTTAAMIGWILHATGRAPTVVNGAVMKNFVTDAAPFASAVAGQGEAFVAEVDESDGSIARYSPSVAVLNNVALDHKSLDELRRLFFDFLVKARTAVVNADDAETAALAAPLVEADASALPEPASPVCFAGEMGTRLLRFALEDPQADYIGRDLAPAPDGIAFTAVERASRTEARIKLKVPGRHNVENALAALAASAATGVPFADAARALEGFAGVRRRLETVGTAGGVTVIDDFAHNPDKIAASLATLHAFPGRLLILFQPHGYGPLKLMRAGFVDSFAEGLKEGDLLAIPPPADYGGTTERTLEHRDAIVDGIVAKSREAIGPKDRAEARAALLARAKPGDRIVVMGARDDTLSELAREMLSAIGAKSSGNGGR
jgi:UDP-N-acetylmuramate--alanine ligase